jgi:hypothetical protein
MTESLPHRFFREVRELRAGDRTNLTVTGVDLARIAGDVALAIEFLDLFEGFANDPRTRDAVRMLIEDVIRKEAASAASEASRVEATDRYLGRPATAGLIGGGGALLYGAVAAGAVTGIGPAILALGSSAALATSLWVRQRAARRATHATTRVAALTALLERLAARDS